MKPLTSLVNSFLGRSDSDWQLKLRAEWGTIMGDLAKRARLERINGQTIVIGVYDSHWMHELHALSRLILSRINNALASVYPDGFSLNSVRCIWIYAKEKQKKNKVLEPRVLKNVKPSTQALKTVEKLQTQELQDAVLAFYIRCKQEST